MFDMIAHGCNCQKAMGAGIAYQIASQAEYSGAMWADKSDSRLPIERLGDYTLYTVHRPRSIYNILNLYTQLNPGKDLNMSALELCLFKVNLQFSGKSIGLPLIGCGIAGGDWNVVKEVIKRQLKDMDVTIVHYKPDTKEEEKI